MARVVVVESECVVSNLDFPQHLDHAWLFIASGIHARLYKRTVDDQYVPCIVQSIRKAAARRHILTIGDAHTWSDGTPIFAAEVAEALYRGKRVGIFQSVSVKGAKQVELVTADEVVLGNELLASPLFTVTPSCRGMAHHATTCGPYMLKSCSPDRRIMTFRKRRDIADADEGPTEVTIAVTENRGQGLRLLRSGHIMLSCPLGAEPAAFSRLQSENTITNRLTNLGLILRPYPDCSLAQDQEGLSMISRAVRRKELAAITENTFVPMSNSSKLFDVSTLCSESDDTSDAENNMTLNYRNSNSVELRYASFEPNKRIAREIERQLLSALRIECSLEPVSYADYVASRFPSKPGISLEIIQPFLPENVCRMQWHFLDAGLDGSIRKLPETAAGANPQPGCSMVIPLLQGATSLVSLDQRYKGRRILTAEAILDWRSL
jgi:hypothetical protein